jgi:predicted GIY-YIG superfamily endonuclease
MFYVYCLRSERYPRFRYIGFSADLQNRLTDHNRGCNRSTAPFQPLILEGYCAFQDKERALAFESYLKSGSGHAFANKRLW